MSKFSFTYSFLFLPFIFLLLSNLVQANSHHFNGLYKRASHQKAAAPTPSKPVVAAVTTPTPTGTPSTSQTSLQNPVLSPDCSTCTWLIQQLSPCVSAGSQISKCLCTQDNIDAYSSCLLCGPSLNIQNSPIQQVPLTAIVSACGSDGITVSAQVTNVTSQFKASGSAPSSSSSSNSNGDSNSNSNDSSSTASSYRISAFFSFFKSLYPLSWSFGIISAITMVVLTASLPAL